MRLLKIFRRFWKIKDHVTLLSLHTSRPIRNIQKHKICCIRTSLQSLSGSPRCRNGSSDRETLQLVICTIVIQPLASIFISGHFLLQLRVPHHSKTFEQCQVWLSHVQLSMKHVFNMVFLRMIMNGDSVYKRQVIWQLEGNYEIFLQLFSMTAHPLILCSYGWISRTKSVMIYSTDSKHRTFTRTLLQRTSMILVFF